MGSKPIRGTKFMLLFETAWDLNPPTTPPRTVFSLLEALRCPML